MSVAGERHITTSSDGSTTIWVPGLDEHYHSIHGARTESLHVFIEAGFRATSAHPVRILEVGLGTALNAQLTFETGEDLGVDIQYHAIEKFPITEEEASALGEAGMKGALPFLSATHNVPLKFGNSSFTLLVADLRTFTAENGSYDLIYFDAFGPRVQPELWTEEIFKLMYTALKPNGILVTYSVKGTVKRALRSVGFELKRLEGPPNKRHMLRAIKR